MLKLWNYLLYGHDHVWKTVAKADYKRQRTGGFTESCKTGTVYHCQCDVCGSMKKFIL